MKAEAGGMLAINVCVFLTSSLESWLSSSKSICLKTLDGGGAWLIETSSTSKCRVAPECIQWMWTGGLWWHMLWDNTWGNNPSSSPVTIAKASRDGEFSFFSWTHVRQTLIPSFNDLSCSQLELEGLVAIKAVNDKKTNKWNNRYSNICSEFTWSQILCHHWAYRYSA